MHSLLGKAKRLEMLDDPAIDTATQEILPDKSVPRPEIERMIKRKERAIEHLVCFDYFLLVFSFLFIVGQLRISTICIRYIQRKKRMN